MRLAIIVVTHVTAEQSSKRKFELYSLIMTRWMLNVDIQHILEENIHVLSSYLLEAFTFLKKSRKIEGGK